MQLFYTVRPGDTLYAISKRWNIPLTSIINANNLKVPYVIYIGQQLSMPPGVTNYVVTSGDSVFSLSQRYGVPIQIIIEANAIAPPYSLVPGQILIIPQGVPYYIVRPGDTLYNIARKYNVTTNSQPRPDLIVKANPGLTSSITPGMAIAIPYPPPGGTGKMAILFNDDRQDYLGLYEPNTGRLNTIPIDDVNETSHIFWSPDQSHIAATGSTGILSIIEISTRKIIKIDQIPVPGFIDWSPDSRSVVYSTGIVIRIYDIYSNNFKTIQRPGALYVQWFPGGHELLYAAYDQANISQLYRNNTNGNNETQITHNTSFPLNDVRLSPNGKFVLYTSPGASISEIYTLELVTGNMYKIPGGPEAKNYFPAWSPDSRKIAYSSTSFINGKYYALVRLSGSKGEGDSTIAISSCYATPITWSADSSKIAYLSGCREEYHPVEIWSIDSTVLVPISVFSGFTFYTLDWSPTR